MSSDTVARLIPSDFVLVNRFFQEAPLDEWLAVLPDGTEIVILGNAMGPSEIGLREAQAVVETRGLLESQAHSWLAALAPLAGPWRLLTIDLGAEARRNKCDFLMCFAGDAMRRGPYVEVGFASIGGTGNARFKLTICSTWGIADRT